MKHKSIIRLVLVVQLVIMFLSSCTDVLDLSNDVAGADYVRLVPTISEMNDLKPTDATRAMAAKHVMALKPAGGQVSHAKSSARHTGNVPQFYLHIEPSLQMSDSRRQVDGTRATFQTNNTISELTYRIFMEGDADGKAYVEKGLTTKDNNWMTDTEWPHGSGKKFRIYSLSPFNDYVIKSAQITNEDKLNINTRPIIFYEMPDSAEQVDLIYAESELLDPEVSHAVTMNYRHLFSGIALSEGSMVSGFKIKTVEIKGLYYKGTCDLNDGNISWTVDETAKKDFTLTKNYTAVGRNPTTITADNQAELMVIPQTAPADATITVTLELPKIGEKKLTASIAGTKFQRGVAYWFLISTRAVNWRYTLNVSQSELTTPYNGGTAGITVNSWRTSANNDNSTTTQVAEPYKIEYSKDNGTTWTDEAPSWLTGVPTYTDGAMSNQTSVETDAQTAVYKTHSANLKDKADVTDYDLSLYDIDGRNIIGGSSTANCYIIRGPGTYRIPCVYGNTLKFGQYNGYAVDEKNESGEGKAFVDYSGTRISESHYKFQPTSADVLWQSTSDVITSPSVTTGNDMSYVTFTVDQANLQQGNAVIAARDAYGTVMWSWHLWITDTKLTTTTSDFFTQNLGWVSSSDTYSYYPARSVLLRISQTSPLSDADPVIITVNQTEADVDNTTSGTGLYYQWGRKDPFRGSDITEGNSTVISDEGQAPLYLSIQSPSTPLLYYWYYSRWNYDLYDWTSDHYNVLWNARYATQSTNTPVEKSVFDPCPYGYRVPRGKKTSEEMFSSLPNMGYYSLGRGGDGYWSDYYLTVSNNSTTKYYWTTRAEKNANASEWYGYVVSSNGYNKEEHCSSLLPVRPYIDAESGKPLQNN